MASDDKADGDWDRLFGWREYNNEDKLAAFAKNVSLGGIPLYSPDITAKYVCFNIRAYNFYANNKNLIMKLLSEMTGKR